MASDLSKDPRRTELFALLDKASKGKVKIEPGKVKGSDTTVISLVRDGKPRVFKMSNAYSLENRSSILMVFRALFGEDRAKWPGCLPGSTQKDPVTLAEQSSIICGETLTRPHRLAVKEMMQEMTAQLPRGSYLRLALGGNAC